MNLSSNKGWTIPICLPKKVIDMMKIAIVLCLLTTFCSFASVGYSQTTEISLNLHEVSMQEALDAIKKQSDFSFWYRNEEVNLSKKVSIHADNLNINKVMFQLLLGQDLAYTIDEKHVIIYKKDSAVKQQQDRKQISGIVTDLKGEPIIGANIVEEGTTNGTMSDMNGSFILNVAKSSTAVISYIGYITQEVKVGNISIFNIKLKEDSQALEEVVVVGYGTQKKVNLTGAISTTDSRILQDRPINSLSSGLQGTVPGLNITSPTGKPGESASINIRGYTSLNGGGPLVLVDGVEMDMNLLNPNDIASVTVLKDAASSAIYGVRAAYGVILITTKSVGNNEKAVVSYSGNVGFSTPTAMPELVESSLDHVNFMNLSMKNAGLANVYPQDQVDKIKAYQIDPSNNPEYEVIGGQMYYYGYNDWPGMVLKDWTPSNRHNISISGGSKKTKFYSSVGFVSQSGLYKINPDKFNRLNTRLVVENQTTSWMKLSLKALYNLQTSDEPFNYRQEPWYQLVFTSPVRPFRWNGDERYPQYDQYKGLYFDDQNPVSLLDLGGRNNLRNNDMWLTAGADFNIMKGWNAHLDFSFNNNQQNNSYDRKKVSMVTAKFVPTDGHTSNNSYEERNRNKRYYSVNAYTEYENTFAEKHYFKGMLGYNQELTQYKEATAERMNMLSPEQPGLSLGIGDQFVNGTGYEWALRGGFFRLNYVFDSRYLIEINGRYDGTSRFPKDNRFVFLPSYSIGWRLSEEKFMSWSRSFLYNLKLRGSYGELGNQLISSSAWSGNTKYYPYIPFMTAGASQNYLFDGKYETAMNPAGLVSSDLTWEKAATLNLGIDLGFFSNRLNTSFDWYQRTTSDMLAKVEYPEILGTTAPPANKAELRTRGWELMINWKDKIGKDFSYDVAFVLSDAQAEITKYDNPTGTLTDHYVGKKIGEIWGYTTDGFFQNKEEVAPHADQNKLGNNWDAGDIKYRDIDGNKIIDNGSNTLENHGDLTIIGNTSPRYSYGFTGNSNYKGFFMNLFIQGVAKRDFWPSDQAFWPAATQWFAVQKWFVTDSWTEDNRDAYFARPIARNTKNQQTQTRYLQDASYLRVKNLTIGYDFSSDLIQKLLLSKLQIYISAENLCELTNVKGAYDPESASKNGNRIYPFQRVLSLGLNLTF